MKTLCKRALALIALLSLGWLAGLRVNLTASMPLGLYFTQPDTAVQRGDLVSVCVPDDLANLAARYLSPSLLCPSGLQPVLKRVAAQPGDALFVDDSGIWINGTLWPDSAIRREDAEGRALTSPLASSFMESTLSTALSLPAGAALVLGEHPGSFDSRYFGLVPLASCQKAIPILTF